MKRFTIGLTFGVCLTLIIGGLTGFQFLGTQIKPLFAFPGSANFHEDSPKDFLLERLEDIGWRNRLRIAVGALADEDIARAVWNAKAQGADIRILADGATVCRPGSVLPYLDAQFIPVRVNEAEGEFAHAYAVFGDTVLLGSYAWTEEAGETDWSNLVMIRDEQIASIYIAEFDYMWESNDMVPFEGCS